MTYEEVKSLKAEEFKRLTGVRRETFDLMLEVLTDAIRVFGRTRKLSLADHLMVTLLYWREYRTQFHLGVEFGVSESTVCRIVKKVETALIQSKRFQLPGRKTLKGDGFLGDGVQVVVVDVTECPVERPQKNKNSGGTTAGRRSATPTKPRS